MVILLAGVAVASVYGWVSLSQPFVADVKIATAQAASAQRLEADVRKLSVDFAGRNHANATALEGAATYVESRLAAAGHTVHRQEFDARGRASRNLVVRLGPETSDVIVIGAHYDVFGDLPGADDNASGVAGVLELARLLKDAKLERRVELVAYANEEPPFFRTPFMGSVIHAKSLKVAGKKVSLMLSLECIGYFSDEADSQAHPMRLLEVIYPTIGNFIALVGFYEDGAVSRRVKAVMKSATSLPVHSINAPGFVVGVDFSDHLSYASEGFVGMMVTDTAFLRNKAYHTRKDTADRLDYRRMGQVVDAVRAVVVREAGAP